MKMQRICAAYFSPTRTTKSVLQTMLSQFDFPKIEIDLTPYENRNNEYLFGESDLVIMGVPVYGGRVPSTAENRIRLMKGYNTPIVLVVTYGNVHHAGSINELQQLVCANGFIPIAAAAIVSEHNVTKGIATGRPNEQDFKEMNAFIRQINEKVSYLNCFESIAIEGKKSSHQRDMLPIKPHGNKKCVSCGICGKLCPTQSIANPRKTADATCIRCMRCIKICPKKARTYGKLKEITAKCFLKIVSHGEKQSAFFI